MQDEQQKVNTYEDDEILIIINGEQVNLGELTLEELIQKSGLTSEYTVETEGKNNPKVREALKTELISERKDISIEQMWSMRKGMWTVTPLYISTTDIIMMKMERNTITAALCLRQTPIYTGTLTLL